MSLDHRRDVSMTRILEPGPRCIPILRLGDALSATRQEHLDGCPRCQSDLILWLQFHQVEPSPDEGPAVQWIVGELGRRLGPTSKPEASGIRQWLNARRLVPATVAIVLTAAVGYTAWKPTVRSLQSAPQVYRTALLDVIAPVGDVGVAPKALQWTAVEGFVVYDVELFEVDHSRLWRGSSSSPGIELPSWLTRRCTPGKTVLWTVTAKNHSGVVVADSGQQQFRVLTRMNTMAR